MPFGCETGRGSGFCATPKEPEWPWCGYALPPVFLVVKCLRFGCCFFMPPPFEDGCLGRNPRAIARGKIQAHRPIRLAWPAITKSVIRNVGGQFLTTGGAEVYKHCNRHFYLGHRISLLGASSIQFSSRASCTAGAVASR